MRLTVPRKWWWLAIGLLVVYALLSRNRTDMIAAAIVSGGMVLWVAWPAGHARLSTRRFARALEREDTTEARRWLEHLPDFQTPYGRALRFVHEAMILSMENKFSEARRVLDQIAAAGPRIAVLRENALAWCEAHDGAADAAVPRAEGALERAQLQYPAMVPYCLGTLGAARVLAGKAGEAIEPLQKALVAGKPPRAQSIRAYYLGEAYRAAGRVDDAIAAYERARREAPLVRSAKKAADRIQNLATASPYR